MLVFWVLLNNLVYLTKLLVKITTDILYAGNGQSKGVEAITIEEKQSTAEKQLMLDLLGFEVSI
jgi:hypothetical protein